MAIAYTVIAELPTEARRDEFVAWLEDGHVDAVIAGGAHSASIVKLDHQAGEPWVVEVRYAFATRVLLDQYVRDHAPALRADGLRRFGPESGVKMRRTVGEFA